MEHPCRKCELRKWYEQAICIRFFGDDCPWDCDAYEDWKRYNRYSVDEKENSEDE